MVPPGNTARKRGAGRHALAQSSAHVRDDVVQMRVALGHHEFVHFHGAGHADPAQVIALQVDQHDMLGALLRIGQQFLALGVVAGRRAAARAGAGDRAGLDPIRRPRAPDAPARN